MASELSEDIHYHRKWLVSLAPVPEAGVWLDLGCGRGEDLILVASKQPSSALQLIGLDSSKKSIVAAKEQRTRDPRIEFLVHDVASGLPFESNAVDVVYSNNLLECLPDRDAFVREIVRVLKPEGWVVMAHWDWDSQVFDSTDKVLARRLVSLFSDWQQPWMNHSDGWMGRRLWGIFEPTGLFEGTIQVRALINTSYTPPLYGHARAQDFGALVQQELASQQEYNRFLKEQEDLNAQGKYFYSITSFAYVGRLTTLPRG